MNNNSSAVDIHQQRILIIDFGSQYSQLIARRVRELGVFCEILNPESAAKDLATSKPLSGIILSGGPDSAHLSQAVAIPQIVFEARVPVLGICYGMQAMVQQLGGEVVSAASAEFGRENLQMLSASGLFAGVGNVDSNGDISTLYSEVWMSHGDHVSQLPQGFEPIAKTKNIPYAAIENKHNNFYGLQFHPEVTHTIEGSKILANFVYLICGCDKNWNAENIIKEQITLLKNHIGDEKVVLGLSGGVDSSVCAALLHRAIGEQLICIFVDTGLLRKGEAAEVKSIFADHMGLNLITVSAEDIFYKALLGLKDPEEKRKAVGHAFIEVFAAQAQQLGDCKYLAQGTIYPDVIESAQANSDHSKVIKSHHNVGGLPEDLPFKLIEPLRELFKDEVRALGRKLSLDNILLDRHPFPGPGLCVRILGEIKPEYVVILQQADDIFIKALREYDLYDAVSQAFAVFLPVKAVGVKGDVRCYEYVIALRAVETKDFMTAAWAHLPYDFLSYVSNKIMNAIPQVSRVVYDISGKPPATIEWE